MCAASHGAPIQVVWWTVADVSKRLREEFGIMDEAEERKGDGGGKKEEEEDGEVHAESGGAGESGGTEDLTGSKGGRRDIAMSPLQLQGETEVEHRAGGDETVPDPDPTVVQPDLPQSDTDGEYTASAFEARRKGSTDGTGEDAGVDGGESPLVVAEELDVETEWRRTETEGDEVAATGSVSTGGVEGRQASSVASMNAVDGEGEGGSESRLECP